MNLAESTETLKPRGRSWHRIPWIGGLFIAAIAALAVWDVVRGYRAAADDTDRELETQARVIAEQTARSVGAVDVVLRHVAAEYKRGRLARLSPDELHRYLLELSVGLKQIDGFGLYDENGNAVARPPSERRAHRRPAGLSRDVTRKPSWASPIMRAGDLARRRPPPETPSANRRIGRCARTGSYFQTSTATFASTLNEGDLAAPQRALSSLPAGGRLGRAVPGDVRLAAAPRCHFARAQSRRRRRALAAVRAVPTSGRRRHARFRPRLPNGALRRPAPRCARSRSACWRCCCWRFWRASCAGSTLRTSR
jgi:hypothetical protein